MKPILTNDSIFINHIQSHLSDNQEVICKICGKTAKQIITEETELKPTLTEWLEKNLKEAGDWTPIPKGIMVMIYRKIKSGEFRGL